MRRRNRSARAFALGAILGAALALWGVVALATLIGTEPEAGEPGEPAAPERRSTLPV